MFWCLCACTAECMHARLPLLPAGAAASHTQQGSAGGPTASHATTASGSVAGTASQAYSMHHAGSAQNLGAYPAAGVATASSSAAMGGASIANQHSGAFSSHTDVSGGAGVSGAASGGVGMGMGGGMEAHSGSGMAGSWQQRQQGQMLPPQHWGPGTPQAAGTGGASPDKEGKTNPLQKMGQAVKAAGEGSRAGRMRCCRLEHATPSQGRRQQGGCALLWNAFDCASSLLADPLLCRRVSTLQSDSCCVTSLWSGMWTDGRLRCAARPCAVQGVP